MVNASPLIILSKMGQFQLLPSLAQSLVIPAAVASEVQAGPEADPARQWVSGPGRTYVLETEPVESVIARIVSAVGRRRGRRPRLKYRCAAPNQVPWRLS